MNMQQGIMGTHASPDLWIPPKNPRSADSGAHFVMLSSAEEKKSAEILGKTIESAEVHYTKPEDEFRRTIGLNTKFRRTKRTAEVRYIHNLCSGVPLKNKKLKSAIFFAIGSGSQDLNFPPIFFPADLMPHNRPQRKKRPQSLQRFVWQTNLRLQCKVLNPRPYLPIGHGWHMWSGGTCLGNAWKIVWTWWWAIYPPITMVWPHAFWKLHEKVV